MLNVTLKFIFYCVILQTGMAVKRKQGSLIIKMFKGIQFLICKEKHIKEANACQN